MGALGRIVGSDAGRFYGVGLGPGTPEWLTDRAKQALRESDFVYCPRSRSSERSHSAEFLRELGLESRALTEYEISMHGGEERRDRQYEQTAEEMVRAVRNGDNVSAVTLGDPALYSTLSSLWDRVRDHLPSDQTELIPGVSSLSASSSRLEQPLAEGRESFAVVPALDHEKNWKTILSAMDTVVFIKINRTFKRLYETIEETEQMDNAYFVEHVGSPSETIEPLVDRTRSSTPDYFSQILVWTRGTQR